jgi:DNA polymerase III subunit epsilon
MAASLLGQIQKDLRRHHKAASADHALLMALQRCAKAGVGALMAKYAAGVSA